MLIRGEILKELQPRTWKDKQGADHVESRAIVLDQDCDRVETISFPVGKGPKTLTKGQAVIGTVFGLIEFRDGGRVVKCSLVKVA